MLVNVFMATSHAANLRDVYLLALENDPVYRIAYHEQQASSEVYNQARALLLPQLSFDLSNSHVTQDILESDNTVFASGKTSFNEAEYSLKMTQSLFDYAKWMEFSKSKIEVKRLVVELEGLRQDLLERVVDRYLTVLTANSGLEYVRAEKKSIDRQLTLTKARHAKGLVRKAELQDATARALQARAREIELENRLNDSLLGLQEILGQLPPSLAMVTDEVAFKRPDPQDPKAWTKVAMEQNPDILIKKYAIEEAGKEVDRQRAGHYPTVNLTLSSDRRDTGGTLFGGGSDVETGRVKVTASMPIFAGGAVTSRTKAAVERHSKAKVELTLALRQVERDTLAAYDGIVNAIAKAESLLQLINAHEQLVEVKMAGYESGLSTNLEVLDAQRDLFFSQSQYALARHEYISNIIALKKAAGTLGENDVDEINRMMFDDQKQLSLTSQTE
jgi:outer membrane protein